MNIVKKIKNSFKFNRHFIEKMIRKIGIEEVEKKIPAEHRKLLKNIIKIQKQEKKKKKKKDYSKELDLDFSNQMNKKNKYKIILKIFYLKHYF